MKNESPFTAYPATNHKMCAREMCDAATFHAHFKITGRRKMWWSHDRCVVSVVTSPRLLILVGSYQGEEDLKMTLDLLCPFFVLGEFPTLPGEKVPVSHRSSNGVVFGGASGAKVKGFAAIFLIASISVANARRTRRISATDGEPSVFNGKSKFKASAIRKLPC